MATQPTLTSEGVTESVKSLYFSLLTAEEIRSNSFKQITSPITFDNMRKPVPGGLYDATLGSFDDSAPCKSCGQLSWQCSGHCGHIDLALPVYNPLLFRPLYNLIQKTCFFCLHFRLRREKVQDYISQLELILKGDMVGDENLDMPSSVDEKSGGGGCRSISKHLDEHEWTSLQHNQTKSVLDKFMRDRVLKCQNCKGKHPKITSPTFGWLQMDSMPIDAARANVIRGVELDQLFNDEAGQQAVGSQEAEKDTVENTSDNVELPSVELSGAPSDKKRGIATKTHRNKGSELPPDFLKQMNFLSGPLLPTKVKDLLRGLWENESQLCNLIFDIQRKNLSMSGKNRSYSMFFMEALLVPPSKFRPPCRTGGMIVEHPQSTLLSKVLECNLSLGNAFENSERSKIVSRWMDLQQAVNLLFDSNKALSRRNEQHGIYQLLERKEGIFRQKLMGKRVNFACRSVISPDPYIAVNEIGIPPYFALRLTYPEKVTPWNVSKLRHAIINGAEVHPGATHYVEKSSIMKLPPSKSSRISVSRRLPSSRGVVAHHGKSLESEFEGKVVLRHLQDGDIVLVNRQPTLHKPSMMAHVVRVLKGEKTLRLHYANCSTYNADFDGDEMNVHFPQDEISRAEAFNIANANEQYVVPTSGEPIRGLIQDHIISAVLLTKKDTFLNREEYHQLLYASCVSAVASRSFSGKFGKKICMIDCDDEIEPLLPAIWKPEPLWTGKQVITTVLNHITRGRPPFTVKKAGRIPSEYFGKNSGENKLLIQRNEFVHGVIDKAQFGKFGLVHTVQELYGSNTAGMLLSVFSRLFTVFLQMHGFTCGVDDLLIVHRSDLRRKKKLAKSEQIGEQVNSQFVGAKHGYADHIKLQIETEKIIRSNGAPAVASLDRMMSSALNRLTSEVNNELFPRGLSKPFPRNCLSLMTTTGAKGGMVNFTQISSLLGQQELEGKRVPRMASGKTLPCFHPWDCSSRAGGFIGDRFLSGLRPQEYYFHCMAGRDGLVDTAVKTARSGYLQRCLVKNLECLKVCYDHTVRDADGSVVQFRYGEDGVDVQKTSFLTEFKILAANQKIISEKLCGQLENAHLADSDGCINELPESLERKVKGFISSLSKKKRDIFHLNNRKKFMKLMKFKYLSSLAQPGEAVGVIAAQSVGEPSTQMTLNTFHFAGRGEMNVTLGIPRLQEILHRASRKISTPVMTCPLREGRTRDDAECLAAKLKRITVADIVESVEVSVVPFSVHKQQVCTIYKLKMKLYPPKLYPRYSDITLQDCETTLKVSFVRRMEDLIRIHLIKLSKMMDIKIVGEQDESTKETDEDEPESRSQQAEDEDGDRGADDDDALAEDLGVDSQKRQRQISDEIEYEDGLENEMDNEGGPENEAPVVEDDEQSGRDQSVGFESEVDQVETDDDGKLENESEIMEGGSQIFDAEDETPQSSSKINSKSKSRDELKAGAETPPHFRAKKTDKAILVAFKGLDFEVHFSFKQEPHILLDQIALKAAKEVYVKSSGNIARCSVVDYNGDPGIPALQTAGVNFLALWEMQDDLDVRNIISNDIHAMLTTYGVEAARATIIKEVMGVFGSYGISVNIRHLTLIADYMTAAGTFRPMNRSGMADTSTSPLLKMTFETASQFIMNAALHGEVERLESPSSRVCLGLPVKMGTGVFDLMQNFQV